MTARGGCRHRAYGQDLFIQYCADGKPYEPQIDDGRTPIAWRCVRCDAYANLGPAMDTEQTAIEVRAVELLTRYRTNGLTEWFNDWTLDEMHGWRDRDDAGGDCPCSTSETMHRVRNWHAGYLARCIHDHADDEAV